VRELPLALDEDRLDVVVGIHALVARRAVADLEVDDLLDGLVQQVVRVAAAGLEPRAHAGRKRRAALVGLERRAALQDVDELVLPRMRVAQRRLRARREPREVHAEVREAEDVAQRLLAPARHARGEGLRIVRWPASSRRLFGDDRDRICGSRHGTPSTASK
jgi:hypothetical protein